MVNSGIMWDREVGIIWKLITSHGNSCQNKKLPLNRFFFEFTALSLSNISQCFLIRRTFDKNVNGREPLYRSI